MRSSWTLRSKMPVSGEQVFGGPELKVTSGFRTPRISWLVLI